MLRHAYKAVTSTYQRLTKQNAQKLIKECLLVSDPVLDNGKSGDYAESLIKQFIRLNPHINVRQISPHVLAAAALSTELDLRRRREPQSIAAFTALCQLKKEMQFSTDEDALSPVEKMLLSSSLTHTFAGSV